MRRPRLVLGLRGRITATVLACTLISIAAVSGAAYLLQERNSRDRFRVAAITETDSDASQAAADLDTSPTPSEAVAAFMSGRSGVEWVVLAGGDQLLSSGISTPLDSAQLLAATSHRSTEVQIDWQARLAVPAEVGEGVTLIELYSLQSLRAELADLRRNVIRIGLLAALFSAVLGAVIAERIHRPVLRARDAARRLESGDLGARVPVHGRDELAQLGIAFNDMAGELERTLTQLQAMGAQQRRFVADVSHELRTPLASLVAAAESADADDPHVRTRAAELLRTQTRRLAALVEDLLEISRFDAGAAVLDREPVDLVALVTDVAAHADPPDGVRITSDGDPVVSADPRRLHTVLRNVVSNALRYGEAPVRIDVRGEPTQVTVRIADHGPGIPPELAALIFDRFVRGDPARSASDGSGLGLAIARENARLHGGDLLIAPSAPGEGATFVLTLPRT